MRTCRILPLFLVVAGLLVCGPQSHAQFYWDANGATTGAGTAPAGTWGVDAFWTSVAAGTSTPGAWSSGGVAVFSAGTDATGTYTVNVSGTQIIGGLTVEEGTPTFTGGSLSFASSATFDITGDASFLTVLTGTGDLTKTGTGILHLDGINTYAGGTNIKLGTVQVESGGSVTHASNPTLVGITGSDNGSLSIITGGSVTNSYSYVGTNAGTVGTATVDGAGSTWTNTGLLGVGQGGTGTLTVSAGGTVSNTYGEIGYVAGSSGTVTINGLGSTWTNLNDVTVGNAGTGTLVLRNGGQVNITSGAGTLLLASGSGSSGTVVIGGTGAPVPGGIVNAATISSGAGAGTLNFNTTATLGSPYYLTKDGTPGGAAVVITGPTSIVNLAGYNVLTGTNTYSGTTTITGGTLVAGSNGAVGASNVTINGGTLSVASGVNFGNSISIGVSGGRIAGNGTFTNPLTLGADVKLSPGSSPGTLNFAAGLALNNGGTAEIEIRAPSGTPGTDWDFLNVTSTLNLGSLTTGGYTLKVISLDLANTPGQPVSGLSGSTSWTIASATTLSGFDAADFTIDSSQFYGGGIFSLSAPGNDLILSFTPVPEPSTYALLLAGLGLSGMVAWRKSRRSV